MTAAARERVSERLLISWVSAINHTEARRKQNTKLIYEPVGENLIYITTCVRLLQQHIQRCKSSSQE
jgi:hypothetical protein